MSNEIATLAGGCFWCLEGVFSRLRGVEKVVSGYMGGHVDNPSYKQVCNADTGHAEVVQVYFDPTQIGFADLLAVFFAIHDPTTLNRQGNDIGSQYRSAVFYHSAEQATAVRLAIAQLNTEHAYDGPIVTEVASATTFWPAEAYHQGYFEVNPQQPYCMAVVAPKVRKFMEKFAGQLK
ncbi:peptide-methionine (S)-S-oxide reductase MsrA [Chitinimonas sp. BJB300]|uniref:peptide-methionine (S)-S-oxide reductase MsrA n=1 Tax=Chitinimonas sp. BJB300 TaxID=1559339 RepID=UPI000C0DE141|nr:peptide-methionine (S)-S-oxide reductase MsrA [Chitinimonas sp. BJB300]PHV10483.1 peptide-methionine (S)-S-oxide reductase [Chitinimonas sp. BJB300]TSJ87116.1 peptide-methionine (S)-S-oxide reductase MsrA [Chitinimonas sp. BJB300]